MLNDTQEMLFLVARDFVQLTSIQQRKIAINMGLCSVGILANTNDDASAEIIFCAAFKQKKIAELVKQMRPFLYE